MGKGKGVKEKKMRAAPGVEWKQCCARRVGGEGTLKNKEGKSGGGPLVGKSNEKEGGGGAGGA